MVRFFGGITEVYIPIGEHLKYYDVNSLYPYASYGDMPGLKAKYVDYLYFAICRYFT